MSAQPADRIPASGPDTGSYEVIHLGGQAAVVVPVSDFLRLSPDGQATTRRPHLASPRRVRAGGRCQGRCAAE